MYDLEGIQTGLFVYMTARVQYKFLFSLVMRGNFCISKCSRPCGGESFIVLKIKVIYLEFLR